MALIVLCALVVASLCGTVLVAGLLMSRPVQNEVGPPPAGLAHAESVRIPSGSGTVLSGWWISGDVAQHVNLQHRFTTYQQLMCTPYLQHST